MRGFFALSLNEALLCCISILSLAFPLCIASQVDPPSPNPVSFPVAYQWVVCAPTSSATTMFGLHAAENGDTSLFALHSDNPFDLPPTSWEFEMSGTLGTHGDALAYCSSTNRLYLTLRSEGAVNAIGLFSIDLSSPSLPVSRVGDLPSSAWGAACFNGIYYYADSNSKLRAVKFSPTTGEIASNKIVFSIPKIRQRFSIQEGDIAIDPTGHFIYISGTYMGKKKSYYSRGLWKYDMYSKSFSTVTSSNYYQFVSGSGAAPSTASGEGNVNTTLVGSPFNSSTSFGQILFNEWGTLISQDSRGSWFPVSLPSGAISSEAWVNSASIVATDVASFRLVPVCQASSSVDTTATAADVSGPTTQAPPSSSTSAASLATVTTTSSVGLHHVSVMEVAAGWYHACALIRETNGVRCWGTNSFGQVGIGREFEMVVLPAPSGDVLTGVAHITAGGEFTCAIMISGGGVRCFGRNEHGQLGRGDTIDLWSPPTEDILTGAVQISAGSRHICALMGDLGEVRCWGSNFLSQLGVGDGPDVLSPPTNATLTGVSQISAGSWHTCALMAQTGGVRCWGYNIFGALGSGDTTDLSFPPSADVLTGAVQVASGAYHTCALMNETGGVRCWGSNGDGALGNGLEDDVWLPPNYDVITDVAAVAAKFDTCVILKENGGMRCWGWNNDGQLGSGNITDVLSPPDADLLTGVVGMELGELATFAILSEHRPETSQADESSQQDLKAWGNNEFGRLGNGILFNPLVPPLHDTFSGVTQIATGYNHNCVLGAAHGDSGGHGLRCWGANPYGQLGTRDTISLLSPPSYDVLVGVSQVALGAYHTCVVMSGPLGGMRCFGNNDFGQLGTGNQTVGISVLSPPDFDVLTGVVQISLGSVHTCALMNNGGVRCWGLNIAATAEGNDPALAILPSPPSIDLLTGITQIAAGEISTCALMNETGGVRCWTDISVGSMDTSGNNGTVMTASGDVFLGAVKIVTGSSFNCVVMNDGGVRCWGDNYFGQLGLNSTAFPQLSGPPETNILTGVADIAAGIWHVCALMADNGGVRCWGENEEGELGQGTMTDLNYPPAADVIEGARQVSAKGFTTCVLMNATSGVRCWGDDESYNLGVGNADRVLSPPEETISFT